MNEENKTKKKGFWRRILDALSSFFLWLCRVHISTSGFEKLDSLDSFLLVSNHVSIFDPISLMHLLKQRNVLFVSKPENFKIPIVGALMRSSGFLAIDRENPRNAIKTIYEAAERVKEGNPMVIYPEGTRNKTPENGLLPFHNGVFKIAKRAGVPIVAVLSDGTYKVGRNFPWRRTDVTISIVDVLDQDFVRENNDAAIGERVRGAMEKYMNAQQTSDDNNQTAENQTTENQLERERETA